MPQRVISFLYDLWSLITSMVIAATMFLFPIHDFVELVSVLITIDFVVGISASIKMSVKITPSRMSKTVMKFLFYSTAIIATYVLQKIMNEGVGLPKICAAYIGATELKSIYNHISTLTGSDIMGTLWKLIKDKIDEMFSGISVKGKDNNNHEPNIG